MSHISTVESMLSNRFVLQETLDRLELTWIDFHPRLGLYANETISPQGINDLTFHTKGKNGQLNKVCPPTPENPRADFMVALNSNDISTNITFLWTGTQYVAGVDMSTWKQDFSFTSFISLIEEEYAINLIKTTAEELGFQSDLNVNEDSSYTLVCNGWA
jgi:hypothetical protein